MTQSGHWRLVEKPLIIEPCLNPIDGLIDSTLPVLIDILLVMENAALREKVVAELPEASLKLLTKIEAFAGECIQFVRSEQPATPTIPNPDAPSARISHDGATIYIFKDAVSSDGVNHELLHVHRYWVEGVPQIMPIGNDDNNWAVTSQIENVLEHLVIVPREADYGFDTREFWRGISLANWEDYPWPQITNPSIRRNRCLLGWVSMGKICGDKEIRAKAIDCLKGEKLFAEAERFRKKISQVIKHKPSAISCTVRFLRIPIDEAQLVTLDIRNRRRNVQPIPKN